ncbi:hypothetical protein CEXT_11381 [Caerostris extrusa]|uniref:Uncharacterized protein n=1 Tax=Caerostris extrusa TaxID=172846 RepID=A0AAV4NIS4_CAEEX|nr:hypothetical protein CEXT_11381 [Caerostris extrusa]
MFSVFSIQSPNVLTTMPHFLALNYHITVLNYNKPFRLICDQPINCVAVRRVDRSSYLNRITVPLLECVVIIVFEKRIYFECDSEAVSSDSLVQMKGNFFCKTFSKIISTPLKTAYHRDEVEYRVSNR